MPRLTTQELQEAKRRKQEEEQRRKEEQAKEEHRQREEHAIAVRQRREAQERYETLASVAQSLYTELDKLAKKAPAEKLTDFSLKMVNGLIEDVKKFLYDDTYLKTVTIFEAAGDNPEYRDVMLVLGQVNAALSRYNARLSQQDRQQSAEDMLQSLRRMNNVTDRVS
ncbi:MAG: hypothetical protein QXX64_01280 [Nitrososphaera sp.]